MIDKLFTYDTCDEIAPLLIVYGNIKLIPSIGKHSPGTEFHCAIIDFPRGDLTLQQLIGIHAIEWKYSLTLQIGELILEPTQ